jgi:hypothetical protein
MRALPIVAGTLPVKLHVMLPLLGTLANVLLPLIGFAGQWATQVAVKTCSAPVALTANASMATCETGNADRPMLWINTEPTTCMCSIGCCTRYRKLKAILDALPTVACSTSPLATLLWATTLQGVLLTSCSCKLETLRVAAAPGHPMTDMLIVLDAEAAGLFPDVGVATAMLVACSTKQLVGLHIIHTLPYQLMTIVCHTYSRLGVFAMHTSMLPLLLMLMSLSLPPGGAG